MHVFVFWYFWQFYLFQLKLVKLNLYYTQTHGFKENF